MYARVVVGEDDQNGGLWCSPSAKTSRPTSSACLAMVSVRLDALGLGRRTTGGRVLRDVADGEDSELHLALLGSCTYSMRLHAIVSNGCPARIYSRAIPGQFQHRLGGLREGDAVAPAVPGRVHRERMQLVQRDPLAASPPRSGAARSYAASTSSRNGQPKRASIARSVSRWPPCAAGSMSTTPSDDHSTLPFQRSPCIRAGGSSSSKAPAAITSAARRTSAASGGGRVRRPPRRSRGRAAPGRGRRTLPTTIRRPRAGTAADEERTVPSVGARAECASRRPRACGPGTAPNAAAATPIGARLVDALELDPARRDRRHADRPDPAGGREPGESGRLGLEEAVGGVGASLDDGLHPPSVPEWALAVRASARRRGCRSAPPPRGSARRLSRRRRASDRGRGRGRRRRLTVPSGPAGAGSVRPPGTFLPTTPFTDSVE